MQIRQSNPSNLPQLYNHTSKIELNGYGSEDYPQEAA